MTEFGRFQIEAARWADRTFGEVREPDGAVAHLAKEIKELAKSPYDDWEYADCLMLILDAAHCAGIGADDLLNTAWEKLAINQQRKWGKPDENGVVEHVRETVEDIETIHQTCERLTTGDTGS